MSTYSIIRFYAPHTGIANKTIKTDLSLEEAQEHCSDPDTEEAGVFFDGFQRE